MSAFRRRARFAALLGGALILLHPAAGAARFTPHLDDLEAEVEDRHAALEGAVEKAEKKERAGYGKALVVLGADTGSLSEEIQAAAKAAKALEKAAPGDEDLAILLEEAADGLAGEAEGLIDDLAADVGDDPESKRRTGALRAIDAAGNYLEESDGETLVSMRLKLMGKAVKKTKPAAKYLAGGGGGGGGEGCYYGTRSLLVGESCAAGWEGGAFAGSSVAVQILPIGESRKTTASFYQCTPDLIRMFAVSFYGTPVVDTPMNFDQGSGFGIFSGAGEPDGLLGTYTGFGTLTFTEVDAASGNYAGTFTFTTFSGGITEAEGTFRITGAK